VREGKPALLADLPDIKGTRKHCAANRARENRRGTGSAGLSKKSTGAFHDGGACKDSLSNCWRAKSARGMSRDSAAGSDTQKFLAGFVF